MIVIRAYVGVYGRPGSGWATAMVWLLVLAVSLALAAVAYHCVEHPSERRLRSLVPSRERRGRDPRSVGDHVVTGASVVGADSRVPG
ncbi:hypothetical protein GCM10020367_08200 [Streptomyces sannanensis]|uniref:Uncharacterized protein n=1 Tax=Streptomyces sannanensis TaxID=285536 RepID=A0ABP6S5V2_9ACTN